MRTPCRRPEEINPKPCVLHGTKLRRRILSGYSAEPGQENSVRDFQAN